VSFGGQKKIHWLIRGDFFFFFFFFGLWATCAHCDASCAWARRLCGGTGYCKADKQTVAPHRTRISYDVWLSVSTYIRVRSGDTSSGTRGDPDYHPIRWLCPPNRLLQREKHTTPLINTQQKLHCQQQQNKKEEIIKVINRAIFFFFFTLFCQNCAFLRSKFQ